MHLILLVVILTAGGGPAILAADSDSGVAASLPPAEQVVKHREFTLRLPGDWREIPKAKLDEFTRAIATQITDPDQQQTYEYGFQREPCEQWLTYPYLLVQVKNVGRPPEAEVARMPKVELKQAMTEAIDRASQSLNGILSNTKVGDPVYDEARRIIWVRLSMNVQGVGEIKALSGMHLSEQGLVCFHGYARAKDFDDLAPLYERIIGGAELAPDLRYQPRLSDGIPGWLSGALVGALVGVVIWWIKQKT